MEKALLSFNDEGLALSPGLSGDANETAPRFWRVFDRQMKGDEECDSNGVSGL